MLSHYAPILSLSPVLKIGRNFHYWDLIENEESLLLFDFNLWSFDLADINSVGMTTAEEVCRAFRIIYVCNLSCIECVISVELLCKKRICDCQLTLSSFESLEISFIFYLFIVSCIFFRIWNEYIRYVHFFLDDAVYSVNAKPIQVYRLILFYYIQYILL